MNLYEFSAGDMVGDVYTGEHYEVLEPDKKGMAKIRNVSDGKLEEWNAYNNNRFYKLKGQLSLFGKGVLIL